MAGRPSIPKSEFVKRWAILQEKMAEADLDIVIALPVERVADFCREFPAPEFYVSIEDVIIKKMEYYRDGGSEKHLRDITGVLKISGERVDRAYIADWASRLGLQSIWEAIISRTKR